MQPYDKPTQEDKRKRNCRVRVNKMKDYFTGEFKPQHNQSQGLCVFLCSVKLVLYIHVHSSSEAWKECLSAPACNKLYDIAGVDYNKRNSWLTCVGESLHNEFHRELSISQSQVE